jgi:hypothetical protein
VKGSELLPAIETLPEPASVEGKAGTTAVAVVFESVVLTVVKVMVGSPWLAGFDHSACAEVPIEPKEVAVKVTTVPAHASFGLTDVSCQADAAWVVARRPKRASVGARRAARVIGRRLLGRRSGVRAPFPLVALNALVMIWFVSLIA